MVIGDNRVLRGGSWNNNGRNVRSANRSNFEPSSRDYFTGFRLALGRGGHAARPAANGRRGARRSGLTLQAKEISYAFEVNYSNE